MKKYFRLVLLGIATTLCVSCNDKSDITKKESSENPTIKNGTIMATFSVSDTKKVYFSMGNLQYQGSTNTWRFAEHQYDMVGEDNENISEKYDGWIDLFGWGTSGWNSGAIAYHPYSISTNYADYYPGENFENNLTDDYANADWGVYNKISNGGDEIGMWRTLTGNEWNYLISTRPHSKELYSRGCVNGVYGLILLPDEWEQPETISFKPRGIEWNTNEYTTAEWLKMEINGAVFLPAAGNRDEVEIYNVGTAGYYWASSTIEGENATASTSAFCIGFIKAGVLPDIIFDRQWGLSVRLIRDM